MAVRAGGDGAEADGRLGYAHLQAEVVQVLHRMGRTDDPAERR